VKEDRVVQRVLRDLEQCGRVDLEASEMTIRAAAHRIGGSLLEKLLNADGKLAGTNLTREMFRTSLRR
jgi:hypothetical protein